MSYADDMGFYAYDDEDFYESYSREHSLRTGIHIGEGGKEIDVRKIDGIYAMNLYNWYLKNNPLNSEKDLLESKLMMLLQEKIREGDMFK